MKNLISAPGKYNTVAGVVVTVGYINQAGHAFDENSSGAWFASDGLFMDWDYLEGGCNLNITGPYNPNVPVTGWVIVCTELPSTDYSSILHVGGIVHHYPGDRKEDATSLLDSLKSMYPDAKFALYRINMKAPVK